MEGHYKDVQSAHTLIPGLKSLGTVLLLIIFGAVLADVFEFNLNTTITDTFMNDFTLQYKIIFLIGVMLREHAVIMIGFCFMDSGPLVSGLSYNGKDK